MKYIVSTGAGSSISWQSKAKSSTGVLKQGLNTHNLSSFPDFFTLEIKGIDYLFNKIKTGVLTDQGFTIEQRS